MKHKHKKWIGKRIVTSKSATENRKAEREFTLRQVKRKLCQISHGKYLRMEISVISLNKTSVSEHLHY